MMSAPSFTFTRDVAPVCQIGLTTDRLAEPVGTAGWVDVSCYVHEAELFRGRDRFTDRFEAGTASITFDNRTGWADLVGSPAVVATQTVRPGRPIRVGVIGPWDFSGALSVRWLWRGFIDQATPTYDPVLHDIVTVNCIDALGEASAHTVPTAPFQGANESSSVRVHRILNAAGWPTAKRKIDVTTTTVQGTAFGSQGIDLLGQVADSEGGVVFGDLDGDVVFRHRDWALYDPDVPPDGVIGNVDPGTPGVPYVPGYIDPDKGYVYWPDPPPMGDPTILTVCADGNNGTLIAQGDEAHLYVVDGQLRFASSGHVWDLGDYPDGGCVGVIFDPTGGGDGGGPDVTRIDDPEDDGTWVPTIPNAPEIPVAPTLSVELLAYHDAGAAEGPQPGATLPPITPGPGALLLLLVSGVCTAGALSPFTISGGGLDWRLVEQRVASVDGAESYVYACLTPRTDPGTFSIGLDWFGARTSRYHVVTCWRANAARADMIDRLTAGVAGSGVTANAVGKGYADVELANDQPIAFYTQPTDATIAQSLAEDDAGPFGAVFNNAEGDWVVAAPPDAPVALDVPWVDDFERADGDIGPNWVLGPGPGFADEVEPFVIVDGAAVGSTEDPSPGSAPHITNMMHWHEAQGPDQVIEVELENIWLSNYFQLYTNISGDGFESQFVDFTFSEFDGIGSIFVSPSHFDAAGSQTGGPSVVFHPAAIAEPVRLRLESDADGTQRVYVDDVLATTWVDPAPAVGSFVGMGSEWGPGSSAPRVLQASGAAVGVVPAKASWVAGYRMGEYAHLAAWDEVNTGTQAIQSTQAAVVVEGDPPVEFGRRILDYSVHGAPVIGGGTFTRTIRPRPNSVLVAFVSAVDPTDVSASLAVTSPDVTFVRQRLQGPAVDCIAQGAIWTAKMGPDVRAIDDPVTFTVAYGPTGVDRLSWVVYEIVGCEGIGQTGSGSIGNGSPGSAAGPLTINLDALPAATSAVIAFLSVATTDPVESGADPGVGWVEELEYLPPEPAWVQTQATVDGAAPATAVTWDDISAGAGTDTGTDAVALAIEIVPSDEFVFVFSGAPIVIGGERVAFNGPIYKAERRTGVDPNGGDTVWKMEPV